MRKHIEAVYEDGVFKPLGKINVKEHGKFRITYSPLEEDSFLYLLQVAEEGESFDFLQNKGEDIYSLNDGEEF